MNSLNEIWECVMDVFRAKMTPMAVSTWFADCEPIDINDKCLVLKTSTDFKRSIIESRFSEEIRGTLSDLFSCDFDFKLLVGRNWMSTKSPGKATPPCRKWTAIPSITSS